MKHILRHSFNFINKPGKGAVETIILINLVLAVVAMFKDIFLASYLGTSSKADAFWLAFFLPDTMGQNLIGVALSAACIPVFSRLYVTKDYHRLRDTVTSVTVYFTTVTVILTVAFFYTRGFVIRSLGPTLDAEVLTLCTSLFTIMLPTIFLFPFVYVGTAVMQVHNRFNIPALVPVVYNLVLFCALLFGFFWQIPIDKGVYLLAAAVVVAAMAMLVLTGLGIKTNHIDVLELPGFSGLSRSSVFVKEIFNVFMPYLLILMSSQGIYFIERYLASGLAAGSVAGLNYAFRITQFPLWVFVAAVSTVSFPAMSKSIGLGQIDITKNTLIKSLRPVLVIILPLVIYLYVLREPVISVLFQRGSFDAKSVHMTAGVMAGYAISVISQGVVALCLRTLMALNHTLIALLFFMASAGLTILTDFQMVPKLGLAGLGYGAAIGSSVNAVILLFLLNRV